MLVMQLRIITWSLLIKEEESYIRRQESRHGGKTTNLSFTNLTSLMDMMEDVLQVIGPCICKSAAGWYVGYVYSPAECPEARWPYSRDTWYMTKEDAKRYLKTMDQADPDLEVPRDDQGEYLEFPYA